MTDANKEPDTAPVSNPDTAKSASDDWAEALAEQTAKSTPAATQAEGLQNSDDWAAALAEQSAASAPAAAPAAAAPAAAAPAPAKPAAQSAAKTVFQPLSAQSDGVGADIDLIMDVPVQLTVELGRTRLTIKNLLQLGQGSVVELDGLAGEPMDIFVNGYLIAQGEVVVVEDRYGIRLTDIITPSERINRLNTRR
ncbi:Flagellar motor switch protein FliN [plant metagenome]|uniref:Flagellar motor switch protein FliN n=2 Tax=root TaxID=1 RepID=A0A1C3JZE8_9BURK|nr:flagellar motor switch protein FliN [Orrella dioscoreae]SBT24527.1 Flagellar motor switch protein FliN [Orrella dioscoreae]SOE49556.1 Flagellar motor switch protein FliN [Orrella dioscoreae]